MTEEMIISNTAHEIIFNSDTCTLVGLQILKRCFDSLHIKVKFPLEAGQVWEYGGLNLFLFSLLKQWWNKWRRTSATEHHQVIEGTEGVATAQNHQESSKTKGRLMTVAAHAEQIFFLWQQITSQVSFCPENCFMLYTEDVALDPHLSCFLSLTVAACTL